MMRKIKKEIAFIYMDSAEKGIMEPLAREAKKRGYKVKLTTDKFIRCEIGFYCQHINFPQFSKFSVIMLHDIIQQYGNWPDIWMREPWNKYDIGILPSDQWVSNWKKCSSLYYAKPRIGMFKVGWPKADVVANISKDDYRKSFCKKYGLDPQKKTVLYAPAWENDNKEDDFVKAVRDLDVNVLIKQYPATPEVQLMHYQNIQAMYELHKDDPRVTILDPKMNIFNAILASDILVSEESSTMAEALMLDIPAISVSNWLIPDTVPSRYPECDYEFVTMTTKEELKSCVEEMLSNYDHYHCEAKKWREKLFCNIGNSSKMIMDIVDDCISGNNIRYEALRPRRPKRLSFKHYLKHLYNCAYREFTLNYAKRFKVVNMVWNLLKKAKHLVIKQK